MAVNPISDTSVGLDAIRLGWAMAEVRARDWIAPDTPFTRPDLARDAPDANFLPLGRERTDHERAIWRDLLLGQRDPESLIATTWNLGKARSGWRVFRVFWPQVLTATIGIVLLSGAAWILASPKSAVSHGLGAVLGVLGFFGITGTGLRARANNTAQQLLAKVRLTYERDLIADAATLRPAKVLVRRQDRAPPVRRHDVTSGAAATQPIVRDQVDVQIHRGGRHGNDDQQDSPAARNLWQAEG